MADIDGLTLPSETSAPVLDPRGDIIRVSPFDALKAPWCFVMQRKGHPKSALIYSVEQFDKVFPLASDAERSEVEDLFEVARAVKVVSQ